MLMILSHLLKSDQVMIWEEEDFRAVETRGSRIIAVGKHRMIVFQWEIYSNFCGGPYAGFSCGMVTSLSYFYFLIILLTGMKEKTRIESDSFFDHNHFIPFFFFL